MGRRCGRYTRAFTIRSRIDGAHFLSDGDGNGLSGKIGLRSAAALVVANIIGAGIFTTTGFQAEALGDPTLIFALWVLGGILAWCGALCYAELGAAMPEAGAEYVYLRETYGPAFGFMSAFVSCVAGFPAPIAAALKGMTAYLGAFVPVLASNSGVIGGVTTGDLLAVLVVWGLTAVHLRGLRGGMRFNDFVTLAKVLGIVAILIGAAAFGSGNVANFTTQSSTTEATLPAFATSLIFVMFCFSGWNAAAYMASEIEAPQRNLPRALLLGTSIVLVLYLGLNAVYLYGANVDELAGKVEVGLVASRHLFGPAGTGFVTVVLTLSLLASASAMTAAGPRVTFALGRDVPMLRGLSKTNTVTGAPTAALLTQGVVTTLLVLSGTVDQIQQYAGFTLALFSSLAVSCVIVLRIRHPELARPFRAWGYPLTPLFYIGVSGWTMLWAFQGRPMESLLALLTVVVGGVAFLFVRGRS